MTEPTSIAVDLTANIVTAYVSKNAVRPADLPGLIHSVHLALQESLSPKPVEAEPLRPPVSVRKSITAEYLISLEDGRPYRTLTRHLRGRGLTPDQYRAKWNLPSDYPMVAPSYASRRSEIAKAIGFGRFRDGTTDLHAPEPNGSGHPSQDAMSTDADG